MKASATERFRIAGAPSSPHADNPLIDVGRALLVTALTLAFYAVFFWLATTQFATWRQSRTEGAFHWLPFPVYSIFGWVLTNWFAIQLKAWYLPIVIGLGYVSVLVLPLGAWSGPGELWAAIEPLVDLRLALLFLSAVFDSLLVKERLRGRHRRLVSG